ncbi:MAG: hypothetical protein V1685_06560 [Parcubacteria group bacterium]
MNKEELSPVEQPETSTGVIINVAHDRLQAEPRLRSFFSRFNFHPDFDDWWAQHADQYAAFADWLTSKKEAINQAFNETEDLLGSKPAIREVHLIPNVEESLHESAEGQIEEDRQYMMIAEKDERFGDVRHEYTHALLEPWSESFRAIPSPRVQQTIIESVAPKSRQSYTSDPAMDDLDRAANLLEEYVVRAFDMLARVDADGGEEAVVAKANIELQRQQQPAVSNLDELFQHDKEWLLRGWMYKQIKEFRILRSSDPSKTFLDYLPILVKRLEQGTVEQ